jgi:hypothetical protein
MTRRKCNVIVAVVFVVGAAATAWYLWWPGRSPFVLPDGPVVAFALDGNYEHQNEPLPLMRRWPVLERRQLDDATAKLVRDAVSDDANLHGDTGVKCFDPGLGFRFGRAGDEVEVLICLHCKNAYFYRGTGRDLAGGKKAVTEAGVEAFGHLHASLFPKLNAAGAGATRPATAATRGVGH